MANSRDNGSGWPYDDGSPDDLPDFPEEWGVIVIPDDLSELADEVKAVRAELAASEPRTRWQRFAARPAVRGLRRVGAATVRAPALIVAMAVLVTIASLFASAWQGPARTPATQRTANTTTDDHPDTLPALELVGADGQTVALRGQLPAVVLLTDGCECAQLVLDTTELVRREITVVIVTSAAPSAGTVPPTGATPQAQGKSVRRLRDPTGTLRSSLNLAAPDGTAAAVLVDRGGEIVRTVRRTLSAEIFRSDLARL